MSPIGEEGRAPSVHMYKDHISSCKCLDMNASLLSYTLPPFHINNVLFCRPRTWSMVHVIYKYTTMFGNMPISIYADR